MEPIKRYSLSKQVADKLESLIEQGKYPIGTRIPTESDLMKIFAVSRNTIREAVQNLNSAGILDVKQGDGTYVKCNNRFDANMSMKLINVKYDEINEARKILEVQIVRLAANRSEEKDLALILKALNHRNNLFDDARELTEADILFHMEIAKAAHNVVLLDLYKSLYSFLLNHIKNKSNSSDVDQKAIDKLHEDLYIAIKDHKPEEAASIATQIVSL